MDAALLHVLKRDGGAVRLFTVHSSRGIGIIFTQH